MLERLKANPTLILGVLGAILSTAVAFGLEVTQAQTDSILALGGGLSTLLIVHGVTGALTEIAPQTVTGIATEGVGVAVAFGLPLTQVQQDSLLGAVTLLSGILLGNGVVHTAKGFNSVRTQRMIRRGLGRGANMQTDRILRTGRISEPPAAPPQPSSVPPIPPPIPPPMTQPEGARPFGPLD